jgi:UDP-2,4-diacetamido-2,4,6-trideoxy-beta-L-altropyranose hydrolase
VIVASHDVVIRADAGPRIGMGHVMRCLALARALIDAGHRVGWRSIGLSAQLADRIRKVGCTLDQEGSGDGGHDDVAATDRLGGRATIIDGYHLPESFSRDLAKERPVIVIDDGSPVLFNGHPAASVLVNPNLPAHIGLYPGHPGRLLIGPRFALLRPEFRRPVVVAGPGSVNVAVVTMGGADPVDATSWALEQLLGLSTKIILHVVVGAENPRGDEIVGRYSRDGIHVHRDVGDMAALLAGADLVITACGGTVAECLVLGRPLVAVPIAENQRAIANYLLQHDLATVVDPGGALSEAITSLVAAGTTRESRARRGCGLVDGLGSERVVAAIEAVVGGTGLRPADIADESITLEWANDPSTRAASFARAEIAAIDHRRWFAARLRDPRCRFWIAEEASGAPVGSVRLDLPDAVDGRAVIHLVVAPGHRGRGLASRMVASACRRLGKAAAGVEAHILPDNTASLRAFLRAGFRLVDRKPINGHDTEVLHWP